MAASVIETYDLLAALFCLPGEFQGDPDADEASLSGLRDGTATTAGNHSLRCSVAVLVNEDASRALNLHIQLPLDTSSGQSVRLHLAQPAWLERKPYEKLSEQLARTLEEGPGLEDPSAHVLAGVDSLKEHAPTYIPTERLKVSSAGQPARDPDCALV